MTRKTKIVKGILSAMWWIAVILLVLLLVNVIGSKMQGKVPEVFGYSVMQIVTGSMEETIPTGTYILVKHVPPEEIKEDDIISFYSDEKAIYGLPNTHRVKEIIKTENGIEFVTRGDANAANDTVNAKGEKLIGVYVASLEALGDFSSFLQGGGMFIIMIILWLATFSMIAYSIFKKKEQAKEE